MRVQNKKPQDGYRLRPLIGRSLLTQCAIWVNKEEEFCFAEPGPLVAGGAKAGIALIAHKLCMVGLG